MTVHLPMGCGPEGYRGKTDMARVAVLVCGAARSEAGVLPGRQSKRGRTLGRTQQHVLWDVNCRIRARALREYDIDAEVRNLGFCWLSHWHSTPAGHCVYHHLRGRVPSCPSDSLISGVPPASPKVDREGAY